MDNLRSYGTPSYYVQKLFANNRGDVVLPAKLDSESGIKLYASATCDALTGEVIVKVVNGDAAPYEVQLNFKSLSDPAATARVIVLTSASRLDENSFTEPARISPQESRISVPGATFPHSFAANSLTVIRFK